MLPAYARLRRRDEFTRAIRGGRRAGRGQLVVHLLDAQGTGSADRALGTAPAAVNSSPASAAAVSEPGAGTAARDQVPLTRLGVAAPEPMGDPDPGPARVGFVVPRTVGNAVSRNLVTRRLRHLARDRHSYLPRGALLVVRALPGAATRSYVMLGRDLDDALRRLGVDRP